MGGLIATTYDWQEIDGDGRMSLQDHVYPDVYAGVIGTLLSKGWKVEQSRSPENRASSMFNRDMIGTEAMLLHDRLHYSEPDIVFHDPENFALQNRTIARKRFPTMSDPTLESLIKQVNIDSHEGIFMAVRGRVERIHSLETTWNDETSSKDIFAKVAPSIGVPTPKTRVLKDLSPLGSLSKTNDLKRELTGLSTGDIVVKAVESSGGKDVFPLRNNTDALNILRDNKNRSTNYVAQPLLPLPAGLPYSIRTVTWGNKVLGAVLLMNPKSKVVSNSHHGGAIPFDLALPGKPPRTGGVDRINEQMLAHRRSDFFDTAKFCSINLNRRELPEEVYRLSTLIGSHGSNALLRGNDFMYGRDGKPLAIESNYHPGPPGSGMWRDIDGNPESGHRAEIKIAIRLIVEAILEKNKM